MQIFAYLKTSLIEWPGKVAAVLFVPGCNFRCPFCHNRDLVLLDKKTDSKNLQSAGSFDSQRIFQDLTKRKKWIDGVVVTGGEPTLQVDLPAFLKKIKKLGFLVMIETNGSKPEMIGKLLSLKLLDFIALDVKGPLTEPAYEKFTQTRDQAARTRSSLMQIAKSKIDFELRTTIVPGLHQEKILLEMAEDFKKTLVLESLSPRGKWFLQNFRPKNCLDPEFDKIRPFSQDQLKNFLAVSRRIFPETELRGA